MSGVNKHINTSLFSAACLLVFFFACIPAKKKKPDLSKTEFIYIQNGEFKYHSERFFPVMLNYVVEFRELNGKVVISPTKEYEDPETFENNNSDSTSHQLQGIYDLLKKWDLIPFGLLLIVFNKIMDAIIILPITVGFTLTKIAGNSLQQYTIF